MSVVVVVVVVDVTILAHCQNLARDDEYKTYRRETPKTTNQSWYQDDSITASFHELLHEHISRDTCHARQSNFFLYMNIPVSVLVRARDIYLYI